MPTATATATDTSTSTNTPTPRPTHTPTVTPTDTPTPTRTPAPLPTFTPAPLPVRASALSDGGVGLSWDIAEQKQTYRIYSDMGAGYGLHVYKEDTNEAAFIDNAAQPGRLYSYKVSALEQGEEQSLGVATAVTWQSAAVAEAKIIPSSSSSPLNGPANVAVIPAPTPLPPDALLLGLMSDASYTDGFDTLNVVGEVINDSNLDVGKVTIIVTFYDVAGSFIHEAQGKTLVDNLLPGERAPFLLSLPRPAGMSNYSVKAVGRPTPPRLKPQLALLSNKRYEDDAGFFHVTGQIKNTGSVAVDQAKAVVTLYGRGGGVINVGFAYPQPATLAPGQTATFNVSFTYFPKFLDHHVTIVN